MSSSPSVTAMETGFLSAVHDEEHFSSYFYSQGQGLDDSEGSLFGGMIVPDLDYDSGRFDPLPLWDSVGDVPGIIIPDKHMPSSPQCKEDFHKMFKDWQEHLTYMQVPESLKADDTLNISTRLSGDIFTPTSNSLPTPSIDELFPLEIKQEETSSLEDETNRMQVEPAFLSEDKQIRRNDKGEELVHRVKKEIKLEIEEDCIDIEIEGEESIIKGEMKLENEDDCVDVETVGDQMPVLEAGDLKSLLEQFEASEAVNGLDENKKKSILDAHLYNMVNQPATTSVSSPPASSVPTNQIIRDSLPKEVIDRIKASGRKKTISLIPAIPNKKSVRSATRMQDAAAALSRNKLLKLVTGGSSGESVQLDHDYCTSSDSMCTSVASSVYHSDNADYPNTPEPTYSRLPDYYVALAPQKALEPRLNNDKWVEKNSKKDSGLESGDVSDASEETLTTPTEIKQKVVLKSVQGVKSVQVVTESGIVLGSAAVKQERKEMPMVSVLKKCNTNNSSSSGHSVINSVSMSVESNVSVSTVTSSVASVVSPATTTVSSTSVCSSTLPPTVDVQKPITEEPIKKKKLNLEEYRVRREERERIRSQENSRASSPVMCLTPTQQPDSTSQADGIKNEKPAMQSVEVQTVDFPEEELKKKDLKSRKERDHSKERRSEIRQRRYRARRVSSSSSSSSGGSSRRQSRRRRRHSRTGRSKSNNPASRMWSRSRSRSLSHSSNSSSCSSRSRSRSRSRDSHWNGKWRSRSPRRTGRYNKNHWRDNRRWQRRSPVRLNRPLPVVNQDWGVAEKMRQVEERRVIYVGRIEEGTTKAHLRERFQVFGPIVDISVHFRERGDNYGFVTFAYKVDAYEAVEHGNDDPSLPHYDLCFGGRRAFCKQRYADLDGVSNQQYNPYQGQRSNESFDLLLREAQAKLRKRSSV